MITPSRRIAKVEYAIRDLVVAGRKLEAAGRRVTYLNIGDPNKFDFAPPPHVVEAFAKAVRDLKTSGYAPSEGIPALREAVAAREKIAVDDVIVTSAMSEGIQSLFAALLDPGDNVLLPSPCYPLYQAVTNLYEGEENLYRCDPKTWEPDLADVERRVTARTRLLVVIDPNNPTGVVYSDATLKGLVDIARRRHLPIFLDQAYDRLSFDPRKSDLMTWRGDVPVIVGYSMSKVFLYPGARCGYLAFHGKELADLREATLRLSRARLSSNHPIQHAFLAALTGPTDYLPPVVAKLRARAAITERRLNAIPGLSCVAPRAAFYAFPKIERTVWKSDNDFVLDLLNATGILTVHGSGFSKALDGQYFRVVFLPPERELEAAYEAIGDFMRERLA